MRVFLRLKYLFLVRYSFAFFFSGTCAFGEDYFVGGGKFIFQSCLNFFFGIISVFCLTFAFYACYDCCLAKQKIF